MISIEDCIALSGLTRDEVDAIGEHEHMPEAAATALASYLLNRPEGAREIREMIVEDIREARAKGDHKHAAELFGALRHFLETH
jgi:hypothetical protein